MGTMSRVARTASLLFSRNPLIRLGDRVLSAVTWVTMVIAIVAVPVAATVGSVVHAQRVESALVEQQTRRQVPATLREDAPAAVDYTGAAPTATTAPAWWLAPDGALRTGTISVPTGSHTGDTKQIWIDRSGTAVGQPRTLTSAVGDGVVVVMAILAGVGLVLAGLRWLVWTTLTRRARRCWERQWLKFEPRWTGRKGCGPA